MKRCVCIAAAVLIIFAGFSVSQEKKQQVRTLKSATEDDNELALKVAVANPPRFNITEEQKNLLATTIKALQDNNTNASNAAWTKLVSSLAAAGTSTSETDINSLVQWILRESYLETSAVLRDYADKVRHYNEQKKAVREHLQELRNTTRWVRGHQKVQTPVLVLVPFKPRPAKSSIETAPEEQVDEPFIEEPPVIKSGAEIEEEIRKWEEKLETIGDDAQLANIDLQSALQRQQQTLQLLSNVSKMLHDTAMAVIRKIG